MKKNGLKSYFQSAIVYYYKKLIANGYDDPVRVIISDFVDTINITDDQKKFIIASTNQDKKTLDDIIIIISNMKNNKEIDKKSLELVEEGLKYLRDK